MGRAGPQRHALMVTAFWRWAPSAGTRRCVAPSLCYRPVQGTRRRQAARTGAEPWLDIRNTVKAELLRCNGEPKGRHGKESAQGRGQGFWPEHLEKWSSREGSHSSASGISYSPRGSQSVAWGPLGLSGFFPTTGAGADTMPLLKTHQPLP